MKQLIINVQVRISVLHRRTIGDDGHWATLLAAAKREGRGARSPVVRRGSLGKGREKGRERTLQFRVWPVPRISPIKGAHTPRLEEALRSPCGG